MDTNSTPATLPGTSDATPAPRAAGRHYMAAKAANTRSAWRAALKDFAAALGLDPATLDPGAITDAALCAYIDARTGMHKPATLTARASILRSMAEDAGVPVVGRHHRDALTVLRRAKGVRPRQAKGHSLVGYHRALAACPDTPLGWRDAALLALATCTAARGAELLSYRFEDIDEDARTILLRRSKTDQAGEGRLQHLSPDAMRAIKTWGEAVALTDGPVLRRVSKSGRPGSALSMSGLKAIVKRLLGPGYSTHSIRVGFVQAAVEAGCAFPEIALTTGQSPATIQRYAAKADQKRSAAAKLLG